VEDNMDKTLRNVIIFAALILVIATVFTVVALSKNVSDNSITDKTITTNGEVQNVRLSVSGGTYIITPSVLKKDVPVVMTADMSTLTGCSRSVVIAAFGVRKSLTESDNVITFTPTQTGTINIACSMNMYKGTFTVE
jgi:plastocyanin domain-containing protein